MFKLSSKEVNLLPSKRICKVSEYVFKLSGGFLVTIKTRQAFLFAAVLLLKCKKNPKEFVRFQNVFLNYQEAF